jgi:hypothetical protein
MMLRLALALTALWLLGCEEEYGIYRSANLSEYPDLACIERVLNDTPGIARVEESPAGPRSAEAPGAGDHHYFFYEGPEVEAHLAIIVEANGRVAFSQALVQVDQKPSQAMVDATRATMRELEKRLERECGIGGLTAAVHEVCLRVECPEKE